MPGPSPIGSGRRAFHSATVQNPTASPVDGDVLEQFAPSPPIWFIAVDEQAGASQAQTKTEGVVLPQAPVVIIGPWRPDVAVGSRLVDERGRVLHVLAVAATDGRPREITCQCSVVPSETAT